MKKTFTDIKVYLETKEGYLYSSGETFPKSKSNRNYIEYLDRIIQEKATLIPYEEPDIDREIVRQKRNKLLNESDSYVLSDFPRGSVTLQQMKDYRQLLRDFPDIVVLTGIKKIDDVAFPVNPLM